MSFYGLVGELRRFGDAYSMPCDRNGHHHEMLGARHAQRR